VPAFKNAVIGGMARTGHTLCAIADYAGWPEGKGIYNWFISREPIQVSHGITLNMTPVDNNSPLFRPNCEMPDMYVACQMIPIRFDQVTGDPVLVTIRNQIELYEPRRRPPNCQRRRLLESRSECRSDLTFFYHRRLDVKVLK
jgi:hypothetical protein